jgi:hypothetical protein
MISTKLAVLMAALITGVVGISAATPLVAEAQIAINERGVRIDQSIVQQQEQEGCTNESREQSNDCEVVQTQAASNVARHTHDTPKNIIQNLR